MSDRSVLGRLFGTTSRKEAPPVEDWPHGEAWDPEQERFIPKGQMILADAANRPVDLEKQMEKYAIDRKAVLRFVGSQLEEADYDKRGYPIQGKLRDYYTVPGSQGKKALTKLGGEKMASFFRIMLGPVKVKEQTQEKDFCSATVSCVLLDLYRRTVGSAVSSCNTAEAGFQGFGSRKKYGATFERDGGRSVEVSPPDYRAAMNDVIARARKRAFVQAVIVATATDEIFVAAEEAAQDLPDTEYEDVTDQGYLVPFGPDKGQPLSSLTNDSIQKKLAWCREKGSSKFAEFIAAMEAELGSRTGEIVPFYCPKCGQQDEDLVGKKPKCMECDTVMVMKGAA